MAQEPPADPLEGVASKRAALLATKFHVPRKGLVPRPRLVARLARGMEHGLTVVCTPPGFGKTTLLGDWARRSRHPVGWLSLDGDDNDPVTFWRHVAVALDRALPGLGEELAALLPGSVPPSPKAEATLVINELTTMSGEAMVALVLDDFHVIEQQAVHDSVTLLLDRPPPGLRLVLASRGEPPLPLARLRARGQLAELDERDLRFTLDETAVVLREGTGLDLPSASVAAVYDRTEGWAAGVQLAALSLRGRPDPAEFVASFTGSHRHVLDYLTEEVLAGQPEPLVEFLLETSVLERLSGPLCDAVRGRGDSQRLLERIERANLFVEPLDVVRGWWRYHQLFADLLRARLRAERPGRVTGLHRAAAAWYQEHGLADDAVRHALASGDADWAAELVEQNFWRLLWRSEDATVRRWLAALPAELVYARPRLCVALASRAFMAGRLEELERLLAAAERANVDDAGEAEEPPAGASARLADDIPTAVAMLRAILARTYGDAEPATRFAKQALAGLTGNDPMARAEADWNLAQADWLGGRLAQAERTLTDVAAAYRAAGAPPQAATIGCDLAQVQQARGRLGAALATAREALELAAAVHPALPIVGKAHVRLADVLRERNELDDAFDHATRGVALCRSLPHAWPLVAGLTTFAWILQAQGDPDGALRTMAEAQRVLPDPRLVEQFNPAPVEAARLALVNGDIDEADRWVQQRGIGAGDDPSYAREREYLVLARVLLEHHDPDRALGLLLRLSDLAEAQGRTGSIIALRILQARALEAAGDRSGALDRLSEALALACPEGYVRVFADEGAPIAGLLGRLAARQRGPLAGLPRVVPPDYLDGLARALQPGRARARSLPTPDGAGQGPIAPLSDRELEVLRLLAAGRSNPEIADELVVVVDTVKKHVSHILEKLGATNRTQAVARARALGLLR
jgi:LuxR family maltose regulon positive regulatory protein